MKVSTVILSGLLLASSISTAPAQAMEAPLTHNERATCGIISAISLYSAFQYARDAYKFTPYLQISKLEGIGGPALVSLLLAGFGTAFLAFASKK